LFILWLAIIFASFGYRAPCNTTVMASFFLAALLISATLYLIVDMDTATTGMIQFSTGIGAIAPMIDTHKGARTAQLRFFSALGRARVNTAVSRLVPATGRA